MEKSKGFFYQIISRDNDVNGDPYRMALVYNKNFEVIEIYEERSQTPNFRNNELVELREGISFHLTIKEYNNLKIWYKDILKQSS